MTTALVVSPTRYIEYLRDREFQPREYIPEPQRTDSTRGGYDPRTGMRVYVHAALPKAWAKDELIVNEERLLLALSLEEPPTGKEDEAEYWLARINLMGWTVTESYNAALIVHDYTAQRGNERWTRATVTVTDEALREPRVRGMIMRKLAYAVWRLWSPDFVWPKEADEI